QGGGSRALQDDAIGADQEVVLEGPRLAQGAHPRGEGALLVSGAVGPEHHRGGLHDGRGIRQIPRHRLTSLEPRARHAHVRVEDGLELLVHAEAQALIDGVVGEPADDGEGRQQRHREGRSRAPNAPRLPRRALGPVGADQGVVAVLRWAWPPRWRPRRRSPRHVPPAIAVVIRARRPWRRGHPREVIRRSTAMPRRLIRRYRACRLSPSSAAARLITPRAAARASSISRFSGSELSWAESLPAGAGT